MPSCIGVLGTNSGFGYAELAASTGKDGYSLQNLVGGTSGSLTFIVNCSGITYVNVDVNLSGLIAEVSIPNASPAFTNFVTQGNPTRFSGFLSAGSQIIISYPETFPPLPINSIVGEVYQIATATPSPTPSPSGDPPTPTPTQSPEPPGSLWMCGNNTDGKLGYGGAAPAVSSPVQVSSGSTGWRTVNTGSGFTVALYDNNILLWGNLQATGIKIFPFTLDTPPFKVWTGVSALEDSLSLVAIDSTGVLYQSYQPPSTYGVDYLYPLDSTTGFKFVAGAGDCGAAIANNNTLWVWGKNSSKRVGNPSANQTYQSQPIQTSLGGSDWISCSTSTGMTAALKSNGTIWCWGLNDVFQCGRAGPINVTTPMQVVGGNYKYVYVDGQTSLAIDNDGNLYAWGNVNPLNRNVSAPTQIFSEYKWKKAYCSTGTIFAIDSQGKARAFGPNGSGMLDNNTTANFNTLTKAYVLVGANFTTGAIGGNTTALIANTDPTPSISASVTPSPTPSPSPSRSPTPTPSPSNSPTITPSPSPSAPTPTPTKSPTVTPSPSPSRSATPTPSPSRSATPTVTPSGSPSPTPSPSRSATPTPTPTMIGCLTSYPANTTDLVSIGPLGYPNDGYGLAAKNVAYGPKAEKSWYFLVNCIPMCVNVIANNTSPSSNYWAIEIGYIVFPDNTFPIQRIPITEPYTNTFYFTEPPPRGKWYVGVVFGGGTTQITQDEFVAFIENSFCASPTPSPSVDATGTVTPTPSFSASPTPSPSPSPSLSQTATVTPTETPTPTNTDPSATPTPSPSNSPSPTPSPTIPICVTTNEVDGIFIVDRVPLPNFGFEFYNEYIEKNAVDIFVYQQFDFLCDLCIIITIYNDSDAVVSVEIPGSGYEDIPPLSFLIRSINVVSGDKITIRVRRSLYSVDVGLIYGSIVSCPLTPTPSPSPSSTDPSPTSTPSPSPTPSPTESPIPTGSPTESPAPTGTQPTVTPTLSPTSTPDPTSSPNPTPTPTSTQPTPTPTKSPKPTATRGPTPPPTGTEPTPTPTPSRSPSPTTTSSPTPSPSIPTATPSPSVSLSPTPTPSVTESPTPTVTPDYSSGYLFLWGDNIAGQIGDDTVTDRSSPVQVFGGGKNWNKIDGGNQHFGALKNDGSIYFWGRNTEGQLGNLSVTPQSVPVQIGIGGKWIYVSLGENFSSALKSSITATITPSPTMSVTPSPTPSISATITPTPSISATITPTPSPSPSQSQTASPSPSPSGPTPSPTPSPSISPSVTPSPTPSPSPSLSPTVTPTPSASIAGKYLFYAWV